MNVETFLEVSFRNNELQPNVSDADSVGAFFFQSAEDWQLA